jgi:hypothetical protein
MAAWLREAIMSERTEFCPVRREISAAYVNQRITKQDIAFMEAKNAAVCQPA